MKACTATGMQFSFVAVNIIFSLFYSPHSFSQANKYTGTWQMSIMKNGVEIAAELKIANGEKNVLFPAQLTLRTESFKGIYHMLLVKKNNIEVGISRYKHAVSEYPFSIINGMPFINNVFTYSRVNGKSKLMLNRLPVNKALITIPGYEDNYKDIAAYLFSFLEKQEIEFTKVDPYPWRDESIEKILNPSDEHYYGLTDTVHVKTLKANVVFPLYKKKINDTISVQLNGRSVIEGWDLRNKKLPEPVEFEPGMNIMVLFADNLNKEYLNTGKISIESTAKKWDLAFKQPQDNGSTFIVNKIYYFPENKDSSDLITDDNVKREQGLKRTSKTAGQFETKSESITLALWDNKLQDGDSISLNINGKWLVKGFPVLNSVQLIQVTLEPGPNQIIFIADNLGSISPNTSVLEIRDGDKRKTFMIETSFDKNNLINIFYDFNPER